MKFHDTYGWMHKSAAEAIDRLEQKQEELREALNEFSTHLDASLSALLLAKHKDKGTDSESYWEHEIKAHNSNAELIWKALSSIPPTDWIRKSEVGKIVEELKNIKEWCEVCRCDCGDSMKDTDCTLYVDKALAIARELGLEKT